MLSFKTSHIAAGLTAVIVGYSSAVVLVLEAAKVSGANAEQAISWLVALGIGMGVTCIGLSLCYRMPIITAWSTPGAAFLIVSAQQYSLNEVTGAFIVAGLLSTLTMQIQWVTTQLEKIPISLSSAMLAGILLPFCLDIFAIGTQQPFYLLLFLGVYYLTVQYLPRYIMLALLTLSLCICAYLGLFNNFIWRAPSLVWIAPDWTFQSVVALAIPLYLITMLSQNLPGIAILRNHGYCPSNNIIISVPSLLQTFTSPFGGFTFNLAAITAALCMGNDVDTDKSQRYWAGVWAGIGYLVFGLLGASVAVVFNFFPPEVTALLAGFALLSTLQSNMIVMFNDTRHQKPALLTFVCCASGITILGIGSAVWGLLVGLIFLVAGKLSTKL